MIFMPSWGEVKKAMSRAPTGKPRIAKFAGKWFCGINLMAHAVHVSAESHIGFSSSPGGAYDDWEAKK